MTDAIASHNFRASPAFDPPKYKISYGPDQVLQWDPPSNSRALAVALSWHFPVEKTLESKMQAAIKVFLKEEQKASLRTDSGSPPEAISRSVSRESETLQPVSKVSDGLNKRPLPGSESAFQVLNWDPDVKGFKPKRQRRKYEKDEGVKVKANRGNACEEHRRRKVKCDPDSCPYNKQRGKAEPVVSRDCEKPGDNLPNSSVGSETTSPVEDEKPKPIETELIAQSIFGPSVASKTGNSIHTFQEDEFSRQPKPKIEYNSHSWIGSHLLTPPSTDYNVSPTQYLQNMHQNEHQDPNLAPLTVQQDDLLQEFNPSDHQDFNDWWLSDYIQTNENAFQSVHSEGNNDQDFYSEQFPTLSLSSIVVKSEEQELQLRCMNSNLLQSGQLITPANIAGPNEGHLRDSFRLESAKFDLRSQLQQPLSILEDSTGLQGFQWPNQLELLSPNYTSLGPFMNGEPESFEAPPGQISDLSAPFLYVSDHEADAELNGYAQAEDIVSDLPAAFDPRRKDIMQSMKNRDILSNHTQHGIAESRNNLEGTSNNEMLRMDSPTWKKPRTLTEVDLSIPETQKAGGIGSARYSEPWDNVQSRTTIPITEIRKYWPYGPTSDERKAVGPPEIQGAAAEYYAVPPIDFNEQIAASSARRGKSGKIRKVARALAAFGNRRSTAPSNQFGDSNSRSLELEIDYPEIGAEELRVGTLPQIVDQHNQYQGADSTVIPVTRRHRELSTATFASSGASRLGVLAGSIGDGPQQRQATFEVPPPVDHELSSTASISPNPQSFDFDVGQDADLQAPLKSLPTCPVDEIRGVGLGVEKGTGLAKMDEPIARAAASASEIKVSNNRGQEPSFKPLHRSGNWRRKTMNMEDFLNDTRLGGWDNEQLGLQQSPSAEGTLQAGSHPPKGSSFKRLRRKDGSSNLSNSSISSVHHIELPSSGKHAVDESMASLAGLSNPDQILRNQRRDNGDTSELIIEETPKLGASALPALDDSDDIMPRSFYRMAPALKIPDHPIQDMVEGDDLEITVGYEDVFPEDLERGGNFEDRPTSQQSTKATNSSPPPTQPAWDRAPAHLKGAGPSILLPPSTRVGPRKSNPTPSAPISISNPAIPSDDVKLHELSAPNYRFQYAKASSMASSVTKEEEIEAHEETREQTGVKMHDRISQDMEPTLERYLQQNEAHECLALGRVVSINYGSLETHIAGFTNETRMEIERVEQSSDYNPTIEATPTDEDKDMEKKSKIRTEEEIEADEEMERALGDGQSLLEEAIRSAEEENYTIIDPQPRPQSLHQKDNIFYNSRRDHMLPAMVERSDSERIYSKAKRKRFPIMEERRDSAPVNAGNKMGERKANRKKAQYCGPCNWVLCLPCVVVEVVKLGGEVVVMHGTEGVEMVKGWIRGLKKGKKEGE